MEKKNLKKEIFNKIDYKSPIPYRMYKHLIEDGDIVHAGYEDAYYGSDSAMEGHFYLCITRMVLETDGEYEVRKGMEKNMKKGYKERRYQNYLLLKEEFEPKSNRVTVLKAKIAEWDELAKDNDGNKHDLSTSERQDWVDELSDLNK
jgi:16S rRNA C967 or C1407 C5-methylase (RsmB/RsmF family)